MSTTKIEPMPDLSSVIWPNSGEEGIDYTHPDVAAAFPWSTEETTENVEKINGSVWPWRLSLGAEDNPNRELVSKWEQVDDLGGLTKLWAGVYNGTIFLHAGEEPPATPSESQETFSGAIIADGDFPAWRAGEPVLPYTVVPMEARLDMLQGEDSQGKKYWRNLAWEPIGLFDVATKKTFILS